jgi:hypothetical protein
LSAETEKQRDLKQIKTEVGTSYLPSGGKRVGCCKFEIGEVTEGIQLLCGSENDLTDAVKFL